MWVKRKSEVSGFFEEERLEGFGKIWFRSNQNARILKFAIYVTIKIIIYMYNIQY